MWASESWPSPEETKARDQFAKIFHPGRPVLTEIVAAVEDKNADTKQLAIVALKSMGEMSYLMPLLSRKDDAAVRRGALAAIRSYTALGPEASGKVREQLVEEFGEDTASIAGKMIVGFSPQEAASPQLFGSTGLAAFAEEESVGVRELALDTLKRLTGRDDQGYDPDHPEGKGYSAWVDLERQGKLRPRHRLAQGEISRFRGLPRSAQSCRHRLAALAGIRPGARITSCTHARFERGGRRSDVL